MSKIYIIGGGPSGMMAAISAKTHNRDSEVILIERNPELGRKLKLTGGGRCNVTANVDNEEVILNVVKNGKFMYSSLNNFNTKSIIDFFNSNDCELKQEDHGRMFPITNKAIDIVNTLEKVMRKLGVKLYFNTTVVEITENKIITTNDQFEYDYLIIGTGGITLPATGSDGSGHEFAKSMGHIITDLVPAEVPLVSNDEFIHSKALQGLSFKDVTLNILKPNGKIKKSITHDFLITHFGISGPASLRASFEVLNLLEKNNNEEVVISVDFIPTMTKNTLYENIKDLEDILKEKGIPQKLIKFIEAKGKNKEQLIDELKDFKINVYTTRGFKHAFVTNGGISTKEINPKTMKSKLNDKISFCGEVMDINAYTGGFNITSALSSGYTAGKHVIATQEDL